MAGSLYARPSDLLTPTWSLTAGSAEALYPVTNLGDGKPYKPFKATSGTATMRATFGGATTLQAIALVSHNLAGVTVSITNGAGLSTTLAVPADTDDDLSVTAWKDLRGLSNPSSTTWNLAVSGASANVAVGEVLLIETVRTLNTTWGLVHGVEYPIDEQKTEMDVPLIYELGVRNRTLRADLLLESDREAMFALAADARGRARAWWLVLDDTENDAMYVRFVKSAFDVTRESPRVSPMSVDVEEIGLGPAL
jgi:hypothetical protein